MEAQIRGLYFVLGALLLALLVVFGVQAQQTRVLTEEIRGLRSEIRTVKILAAGPPPIRKIKGDPLVQEDVERYWRLVEGAGDPNTAPGR